MGSNSNYPIQKKIAFRFFFMLETKICSQCQKTITDVIMPAYSICGCDGLDRKNCWQKCYECDACVCRTCIVRHQKCTGTYCAKCFPKHTYVPKLCKKFCTDCLQEKELYVYENICGFDWEDDKNYWIENVCEQCHQNKN